MLWFVFVVLISFGSMVNANAQTGKESNCTVTQMASPITKDAMLTVRMKKGDFCLHRYDVSALDRPNVIARGFARRGHVVTNGENLWGYRAPSTAGSDRFSISVSNRLPNGSRSSHLLTYEVTVTE